MYSDLVRKHLLFTKFIQNVTAHGKMHDGVKIHRWPQALKAVEKKLPKGSTTKNKPLMADYMWSIIKQDVSKEPVENMQDLKKVISRSWTPIDSDKQLCKKLIFSIPVRCKAVISKNGEEILKTDCYIQIACLFKTYF